MMPATHLWPEIPGYIVIELLYCGSRTAVYRAVQVSQPRPVVLKVLQRDYPSFGELLQFRNQYTIAKNLSAPGIVQPLRLEPLGNSYVLVMEDGGEIALTQYMQQPLSLEDVLRIGLQLTDILHDLSQQQVVHKDIKPANILIHPETKQIKLIDFSIASLLPKETQEVQSPHTLEGTLAYLAPEQTGRMNRGIDYRADFYALGITLYQLLTGTLPFASDDPLELVHCHIAKVAVPANQVDSAIPATVAAIVAKLMAKNAEDRYQSAIGLKHDLQQCLTQWHATGQVASFQLGQRDLSDRFLIPEKLYGRQTEVTTLLKAFDRVARGSSELVLIAGFSGIGKTAVVNEVQKPIVRQRGYFIQGKFDQFNRNIPLSAFVQALRDLMGQLLTESDDQLAQWRTQILAGVGENGQVLIDVIPELQQIIGQQPIAPELSVNAAQNRFNLVLQTFIEVFTTAHPLVMFLDDLQWADSASLQLIPLLMHNSCLLILGAYRDNEVSSTHPLVLTVKALEKANITVNPITLAALTLADLNHLVADTLNCSPELAQPLSELVHRKTQGNPFFATQFLKALYEAGQICFDRDRRYWICDIAQIQTLSLTEDVVQFMALQLQKLPAETQNILKLAACIGNQFDLTTLAIGTELPATEVATALWKALQEGLVLPTSQIYKFFQDSDSVDPQAAANPIYRFLHDRVQQAADSLIPTADRAALHYRIGQLLRNYFSASIPEERIFDTVGHLNAGSSLITDLAQQIELAQLNQIAANKAMHSTAYESALIYLNRGIALLPNNAWSDHYALTLKLHHDRLDAAYLNGHFDDLEAWGELVLKQANTLLDRIKVYETRMMALRAQGRFLEVVHTGLQVLQLLGFDFPLQPTSAEIAAAHQRSRQAWQGRTPRSLLNLPKMQDPQILAAMQIMTKLVPSAHIAAPSLLPLLSFKQIELSIQYGNCPISIFSYADYGLILCGMIGDIPTGYEFGQLALALLDSMQMNAFKSRAYFIVNSFTRHWQEPLQHSLSGLLEGYRNGLENGDWECVALNLLTYSHYQYWTGAELQNLAEEIVTYRPVIEQVKQEATLLSHEIYLQVVLNLLGQAEIPYRLEGDSFNVEKSLPVLQAANDRIGLFHVYLNQALLGYWFEQNELAVQSIAQLETYSDAACGFFVITVWVFYAALIRLRSYSTAAPEQQRLILQQVAIDQAKLQQWAVHAPQNHQHRWQLIAAEQFRLLGQRMEAIEQYDEAIAAAQANGYLQETALANELAAKFYLDWGKEKVAAGYLQAAYYDYARWGAKAKIQDLERRYPQLLAPILQHQRSSVSATETVFSTQALTSQATQAASSDGNNLSATLDLATVLKASQTLASEIHLDQLLATLLETVLENAGADQGALLMPRQEQWFVEAIATLDQPAQIQSVPLSSSQGIPQTLINQVKRNLQPVVIADVATHPTTMNAELQQPPQSLLCIPIMQQGKLVAILYLENHVSTAAFTNDRVELLKMLCTQAASFIDNARLYQQSQQALAELRTSEARFQKLAANIPGMIYQFQLAATGDVSTPYVSSGCLDLYELEPEAVMAGEHNLYALHHPEDHVRVEQAMLQSAETLTPFIQEWRIMTASGVKWVQAAARPEKKADGSTVWDGIVIDVSDRKRAEQLLQKQTQADQVLATIAQTISQSVQLDQVLQSCIEQVRQFFQSDRVLICRFDSNYDLLIEVEALSHPELSLLGQTISDPCFDQSWAERYRQGYVTTCNDAQTALSPCYAQLLAQKQVKASLAVGILQADQIWGLMIVHHCQAPHPWQPFEVDLLRQLGLEVGIASQKAALYAQLEAELTERRRTEAALRLSENRYLSLISVTSQIVWIAEPDGRNVASPNWCSYTGQSLDKLQEFGWLEALHPDDREHTNEVWQQARTTKSWYRTEYRIQAVDGSYRYFDVNGVPILTEDGGIREWIGTCTDIDDRKRAEAELQQRTDQLESTLKELQQAQTQMIQAEKMSALGQLVAGVAHEINNPVNFIYGNLNHADDYIRDLFELLQLYQQSTSPHAAITQKAEAIDLEFLLEDLPKLLASMKVGADRIQNIVASLRNFSRMDESEMKAVNIHDGIDSTLMILQHRLKPRGSFAGIEVIKSYGNLPLIECYAGQLNQVFMNLLSNAIDALEEGYAYGEVAKPQITICTSFSIHAVSIQFIDNGAGIPTHIRQRLFDPFFTTKPVGKGTGMGLSISYQIVAEKHRGTLKCTSEPGQGTTFTVTIPRQQERVYRSI